MRVPPEPDPAPPAGRGRVPRAPRAPRVALIVAIATLFVLVLSLRGIARVATDYLWFDELDRTDVWRGLVTARFLPAIVSIVATFALMMISLAVAERLAPQYRNLGPEDELVERYRAFVGPFAGRLRAGIALLFAITVGANAASQWEEWLLFRNGVDFGTKDPQFHRDLGFYMFELPFIRFALGLTFAALLVTLLVTTVAHYLNGGIRFQSPFQRVTPQVKGHLSVLLALMAIVKAVQYYFDRFELVFSRRGPVDGASYTDVNVQLPAFNLLIVISVIAAILFIVNIWQRGFALPVIAVGLWGFVSIVVGTIAPATTQAFSVKNSEQTKERPYIARNIEATRAAYALDDLTTAEFETGESVGRAEVEQATATIDNARLWDPLKLQGQFNELQGFRSYYAFPDLDIDRYRFGDEYRSVIIATRELNPAQLPSNSWVARHLIFTHGNGAVVAAANEATDDGGASFRLRGIPPTGELAPAVDRTGIYYGESIGGYVVVGSPDAEVEAASSSEGSDATVEYAGRGGVPVSGIFTKAALALRFWDKDLFLSSRVTDQARVMWNRDVGSRVETVAPFLHVDGDPYPVLLDGRVLWVVDAYTTTDRYPYAQSTTLDGARGLGHDFNYVRNSVKAVVDAYDGSLTLYAWDDEDPILRSWRKAFPDLFTDRSEIPTELLAHFRYPEELFKVQSAQYAEYHVTDPDDFYGGSQQWQIAPTATDPVRNGDTVSTTSSTVAVGNDGGRSDRPKPVGRPAQPMYLMMSLPGSDEAEFVLTRPYAPIGREQQLQSFVVARSDPEHYGELIVYQVTGDSAAISPSQAAQLIQRDQTISSRLTLIDNRGSSLQYGEMQVLPIGDRFLYLQPIYIASDTDRTSFLTLAGVAVTDGEQAVFDADLDTALARLFGTAEPTDPVDPTDPGDDDATVAELLARAEEAFELADRAAATGDYEEQGRQLRRARNLVREAVDRSESEAADPDAGSTTSATTASPASPASPATTTSIEAAGDA